MLLSRVLHSQAFGSKNIDMFLKNPEYSTPRQPPPFTNRPETNGGLRLPPVRPRVRNPANPIEARASHMTKAEAEEAKSGIFAQLDEFEECADISRCALDPTLMFPFTGMRHLLFNAFASSAFGRKNITRLSENT